MPVIKCNNDKWKIGIYGKCMYTTKAKADAAYKAYLASKGKKIQERYENKMNTRQEGKYNCECLDCGHTLRTDKHCVDIKCPECGGKMRRKERPGPGRTFKHNSIFLTPEPPWNSIRIDKLPEEAFCEGGKKLRYAHHWIHNGRGGSGGRYNEGKMYLSKGGVIESYHQAVRIKPRKRLSIIYPSI